MPAPRAATGDEVEVQCDREQGRKANRPAATSASCIIVSAFETGFGFESTTLGPTDGNRATPAQDRSGFYKTLFLFETLGATRLQFRLKVERTSLITGGLQNKSWPISRSKTLSFQMPWMCTFWNCFLVSHSCQSLGMAASALDPHHPTTGMFGDEMAPHDASSPLRAAADIRRFFTYFCVL